MGQIESVDHAHPICLNCGAALTGAYCGDCGQSSDSPVQPLPVFVQESLSELVSWDSSHLRTLRLLVARPGALTTEYLDGKRVSYVHPVRLFVAVGVATYFATRFIPTDFNLFGVAPELFGEDLSPSSWLATVGFIVGGVGAHWVALRQDRPMVMEHAVFVLHVLTYSFLLAPIEGLLYLAIGGVDWLGVASFLFAPSVISAYWLFALRRFLGRDTLLDTYVSAATTYGLFAALILATQLVGLLVS